MSASEVLQLIQAVNAVTTLAAQLGISLQQLASQQNQAVLEGRKFDLNDVEIVKNRAAKALERLNKAIAMAKPTGDNP